MNLDPEILWELVKPVLEEARQMVSEQLGGEPYWGIRRHEGEKSFLECYLSILRDASSDEVVVYISGWEKNGEVEIEADISSQGDGWRSIADGPRFTFQADSDFDSYKEKSLVFADELRLFLKSNVSKIGEAVSSS
jgi:hypothetical protein